MHLPYHWAKAHSMRCRVSQNWASKGWASKGWGGMVIPRIGMEVVVEFLEGDPDKPLVTGCVYNGKNDVPYELPKHKTRSTFKTDTHQGTGFNELRFEDKAGEDEVYIHAEKDMNVAVENVFTEFIGGNRHSVTDYNSHDVVQLTKTSVTGVSERQIVGKTYRVDIGAGAGLTGMASLIGRKADLNSNVMAALFHIPDTASFSGFMKNVAGDNLENISGYSSMSVGESHTVVSDGAMTLRSLANVALAGTGPVSVISEDNTLIFGGNQIVLKCGKSEIRMTKDGTVKITGTRIDIN